MSKVFVCKGNEDQNIKYVTKERSRLEGSTPVILGNREEQGQGKRNDLKLAAKLFLQGGYPALLKEKPEMIVKFPRGFDKLEEVQGQHRNGKIAPKVFVLWGPTGCGKTKLAHQLIEKSGLPAFNKNTQTKWWDMYRNEKIVLMDEFVSDGKSGIGLGDLLLWMDRYEVTVEVKGGARKLGALSWILTSNFNPVHWFPTAAPDSQAAWNRRITGSLEWSDFEKKVHVFRLQVIKITNCCLCSGSLTELTCDKSACVQIMKNG